VDVEISLATKFHWSLYDIDRTDALSLLPFIRRLTTNKDAEQLTYCDQVDWLD
jgi:hypothetical protein